MALMKLVEEVKAHSSKWIKTKGDGYKNFYWQNGYGAFSVDPSKVDTVIAYIAISTSTTEKRHFRMNTERF
jgi:hypothetical protein